MTKNFERVGVALRQDDRLWHERRLLTRILFVPCGPPLGRLSLCSSFGLLRLHASEFRFRPLPLTRCCAGLGRPRGGGHQHPGQPAPRAKAPTSVPAPREHPVPGRCGKLDIAPAPATQPSLYPCWSTDSTGPSRDRVAAFGSWQTSHVVCMRADRPGRCLFLLFMGERRGGCISCSALLTLNPIIVDPAGKALRMEAVRAVRLGECLVLLKRAQTHCHATKSPAWTHPKLAQRLVRGPAVAIWGEASRGPWVEPQQSSEGVLRALTNVRASSSNWKTLGHASACSSLLLCSSCTTSSCTSDSLSPTWFSTLVSAIL